MFPGSHARDFGPPAADGPLLRGLTEPQRQAVLTTEGPVLVLAGPGSGKTGVITRRIAHLLSMGVPPWQVLAVTFTNKAAAEMRERVSRLLGADDHGGEPAQPPRGLTISTFHALCARLLRRYAALMEGVPRWGVKPDYTIYDTDDQLSLMKRVIAELSLSTTNWPPRTMLGAISSAKNELLDPDAYAQEAQDFHGKSIARIYASYEKALRGANAVDFDDLLLLTVRLLRENEEARAEVQRRWKYLMIDEYQDTNRAQFVLSTLLVGKAEPAELGWIPDEGGPAPARAPQATPRGPNVCVVGDPDQSIYGWRGADISNILDFEEQYPGVRVISLGQNFRSTAPILAIADGLIRKNKLRKHKPLFTQRQGGERPTVVLCRDEHHEAALVTDWIRSLHRGEAPAVASGAGDEGPPPRDLNWKDFAIFYRNNALSRVIEDRLRGEGVPYTIVRGTAFYQREEVKDAVAYLRVVANPADEVSLRRIVNKPARKISSTTVDRLSEMASGAGTTLFEALRHAGEHPELTPAAVTASKRFVELVEAWTGGGSFLGAQVPGSLHELVTRILVESGLEAHYRAAKDKGGEEEVERLANLQELVNSAKDFEEAYDPAGDAAMDVPSENEPAATPPLLSMVRAYLERISLVADADAVDPAGGTVTLMTLHAAKGLEFPAVAMIGLEEGLLPSARALEADLVSAKGGGEAEEERRLCFVGITRAMEHLLITCAKYRSVRGLRERTIPSRFLRELPEGSVLVSDQSDAWDDADDRQDRRGFDDDDSGPALRRGREGMSRPAGNAAGSGNGPGQRSGSHFQPGGKPAAPRPPSKPVDDPQFPAGSQVRHAQFGIGRVREVTGMGANRRATIEFKQTGVKVLVLQFAKLERLG